MIWFTPEGKILKANENFLNAVGYSLEEVVGKHHRIFMAAEMAESPEYKAFWTKLAAGEALTGEFPRKRKDGHTVYIEASYNPIFGPEGKVEKVVKFAIDVTAKKRASADAAGQLEAISRSQAVIEFEPDGTILTANENFLAGLGYTLDEVQGQHHRMFCEGDYASSAEYSTFWEDL
ncbi:MAG: PAS domain S-box protein, partial [Silicimonas sp.]|nr:PAS domain S-box protein [Silicimonas sp.]